MYINIHFRLSRLEWTRIYRVEFYVDITCDSSMYDAFVVMEGQLRLHKCTLREDAFSNAEREVEVPTSLNELQNLPVFSS